MVSGLGVENGTVELHGYKYYPPRLSYVCMYNACNVLNSILHIFK